MKWGKFLSLVNKIWPLKDAEKWDNSGLLIGSTEDKINSVMVALDLTDEVIEEAIEKKCNGIITHHPLIFSPLKQINTSVYPGIFVKKCIQNNINLLALHTNLDVSPVGPSFEIGRRIGLKNINFLRDSRHTENYKLITYVPEDSLERVRNAISDAGAGIIGDYSLCSFSSRGKGSFLGNSDSNPQTGTKNTLELVDEYKLEMIVPKHSLNRAIQFLIRSHPYEEVAYDVIKLENKEPVRGMGVIGETVKEMEIGEISNLLIKNLDLKSVIEIDSGKKINKIAIVSGSGTSMMNTAIAKGAQLLITGDVKHHQAVEGRIAGLSMIDAGHYGTEKITKEIIKHELSKLTEDKIEFYTAENESEPFKIIGVNENGCSRYCF